jgi:hypothetical protein
VAKVLTSLPGHEMLTLPRLRIGVRKPSRSTMGRRARVQNAMAPERPARAATRATTIRVCRRAIKPRSTRRAGVISARGWKRPFDEPISLPRGRQFVTLEDAGRYITKLPKAEHEAAEWQAAMEALILGATLGGPTMFARIGVMRALNRNVERVFDPSRKDHHWGRRDNCRGRRRRRHCGLARRAGHHTFVSALMCNFYSITKNQAAIIPQ